MQMGISNLDAHSDTVGKPEINLYQYSLNNPVNWIDPKGLCTEDKKCDKHQPELCEQPTNCFATCGCQLMVCFCRIYNNGKWEDMYIVVQSSLRNIYDWKIMTCEEFYNWIEPANNTY